MAESKLRNQEKNSFPFPWRGVTLDAPSWQLFQTRLDLSGKKTSGKAGKGADSKKKNAVKRGADQHKSPDLWIAPKPSSTNGAAARKWSESPTSPTGSRLLELADIALGLKKPENFHKRRSGILKPKP